MVGSRPSRVGRAQPCYLLPQGLDFAADWKKEKTGQVPSPALLYHLSSHTMVRRRYPGNRKRTWRTGRGGEAMAVYGGVVDQ
jgi:hypothetical protein